MLKKYNAILVFVIIMLAVNIKASPFILNSNVQETTFADRIGHVETVKLTEEKELNLFSGFDENEDLLIESAVHNSLQSKSVELHFSSISEGINKPFYKTVTKSGIKFILLDSRDMKIQAIREKNIGSKSYRFIDYVHNGLTYQIMITGSVDDSPNIMITKNTDWLSTQWTDATAFNLNNMPRTKRSMDVGSDNSLSITVSLDKNSWFLKQIRPVTIDAPASWYIMNEAIWLVTAAALGVCWQSKSNHPWMYGAVVVLHAAPIILTAGILGVQDFTAVITYSLIAWITGASSTYYQSQ